MADLLQRDTPAPDFSLPDAEGKPVKLSDYQGKNVVLAFYPADWSPVCTSQLSLYQETLDEIRSYDAEVLAISVDGNWSHKAWGAQHNISFPLLSDFWPHGSVSKQYGVFREQNGFDDRALFFIDKQGVIRDTWVGEHPGISPGLNIVFDALGRLQEADDQDGQDLQTPVSADDWSSGPADAPVTIVEYLDFECPHCRDAREVLHDVRAAHPDQVRLVVRHFPITSIHPHAQAAAEAAEAAGAQGKFWEMHDLLFMHQDKLGEDDLRQYAQQLGLDQEQFEREMTEHTYEARVKQSFRNGITDGVNGTPTLFINGMRYDGPREREVLLEIVAAVVAPDQARAAS